LIGEVLLRPLLDIDELSVVEVASSSAKPSVAQFGKSGKIPMLSSPWIQSGIFWFV